MQRKRVGLLGGTFDPIHFGHLNLAFELMERRGLDQVWFIPAQVNPLKVKAPPHRIDCRLKMLQLAIEGIGQFHVKDVESNRAVPSYTIDTLKMLIAEQQLAATQHEFYLLLGDDAIGTFSNWQSLEQIIQLVPLLIGERLGRKEVELKQFSCSIQKSIEEGLTPIRLLDISSTDIRVRLAKKLYCGHLVPASVLDYIQENQLYLANLTI